jgi:hypothetical protein
MISSLIKIHRFFGVCWDCIAPLYRFYPLLPLDRRCAKALRERFRTSLQASMCDHLLPVNPKLIGTDDFHFF